jgi:DNA (cytosine-5)-methyltransferase 1
MNRITNVDYGTSAAFLPNPLLPAVFRVANVFAGVGGNRKLWEDCQITAVENDIRIARVYQKLNPNDEVIVADGYDFIKQYYKDYDFIWASPPCQGESKMNKATRHNPNFPDFRLYSLIVFLKNFYRGKWVVENVVPYYEPLIKPTAQIGRHLFWSNFPINAEEVPQPKNFINKANLQGKKEMMDWLGLQFDEVIYYKNNHCPVQILRNCVHPKLGLAVFSNGR